jgi:hypothetical protein
VRKEQLRSDAEAQILEDVACLVFLRYYALSFAREARGGEGARHPRQDPAQDVSASSRGRARFRSAGPVLALYELALKAADAAPAR